jgi:hypothetical protein
VTTFAVVGRTLPALRHPVGQACRNGRGSTPSQASQLAYDAYVRPLAEIFWQTNAKIVSDPACFEHEKALYEEAIAEKRLPYGYYERWFYFMNPAFCEAVRDLDPQEDLFHVFVDNGFDGGVSGNVTKTVVGFWLRRAMDGTLEQFREGLTRLVSVYQPSLLGSDEPDRIEARH